MEAQAADSLLRFFRSFPDPRASNVSHSLNDVMIIAILAVLCGCEGWASVEGWTWINLKWLRTFLDLSHGVPSHDTFDRVFALMNPAAFERAFMIWTDTLVKSRNGLFIAVDGKTLRRSFKHAWSKSPVHLVSAFVSKNHVVLGQLATDAKSNEITAIPKLLALLELAGTTLTIDAMGCQKLIAGQIIAQQAHYILAVKENQPALHAKVKSLMDEAILESFKGMKHDFHESSEEAHGRMETRKVWCTPEVKWLGETGQAWPSLNSLIVVESRREMPGEPPSIQRRYFISSHDGKDARCVGEGIRLHWGVENGLHWSLDVGMNEDQCRLRVKQGAENFSRLRRIALNKLKRWEIRKPNGKILKAGIKTKQQACGWSREFLIQALLAQMRLPWHCG